jgi:hypothetical protein
MDLKIGLAFFPENNKTRIVKKEMGDIHFLKTGNRDNMS